MSTTAAIAIGLGLLERRLRTDARPLPPGARQLLELLTDSKRHDATTLAPRASSADGVDMTAPHLLDIEEVADALRVSPRQVQRYVRDEQLRSVRLGRSVRFHPADVEDFVDGLRTRSEDR